VADTSVRDWLGNRPQVELSTGWTTFAFGLLLASLTAQVPLLARGDADPPLLRAKKEAACDRPTASGPPANPGGGDLTCAYAL